MKHKPQHAKHEKKIVPGDTITALLYYLSRHAYLKTDPRRQGAKMINAINCHPAVQCGWKLGEATEY